jgi:hypothetical protein
MESGDSVLTNHRHHPGIPVLDIPVDVNRGNEKIVKSADRKLRQGCWNLRSPRFSLGEKPGIPVEAQELYPPISAPPHDITPYEVSG